jgi:hypothetical protein
MHNLWYCIRENAHKRVTLALLQYRMSSLHKVYVPSLKIMDLMKLIWRSYSDFIYFFNDVSSSDYIASNGKKISE